MELLKRPIRFIHSSCRLNASHCSSPSLCFVASGRFTQGPFRPLEYRVSVKSLSCCAYSWYWHRTFKEELCSLECRILWRNDMSFGNRPERLSYEQYGSKLAFAFRHAHSEIFWFCFFFFLSKRNPKDFATL